VERLGDKPLHLSLKTARNRKSVVNWFAGFWFAGF